MAVRHCVVGSVDRLLVGIGPLFFRELQELSIPGADQVAAVPPVDNKFRHQILRELPVDITHLQYVEHGLVGLPVVADRAGCGVHLQGVREARPLAFDVLNKA